MRSRGLTVPELLVVIGLLAVASFLLIGLFSSTLRISARETTTLELEQTGHFLIDKLESDLQSSGAYGISYLNDEVWKGVSINPIDDVSSEGNLVWEDHQIVYLWSSSLQSVYKLLNDTGGGASLPLTPTTLTRAEMLALASSGTSQNSRVGRDVTQFAVEPDASGRLVNLTIELERNLPNDQPRRYRLNKSIILLN